MSGVDAALPPPLPPAALPPSALAAEPGAHPRGALTAALRNPLRILELALGDRPRLLATIDTRTDVAILVAVLLLGGILFALPFGLALGAARFWDVAVLFEGSLLICFPALHVFGVYFGLRVGSLQSLALVAWATCVAALFTFGFAPIQWFLTLTMQTGDLIAARDLAIVLLVVALLAGIATLLHAARRSPLARWRRAGLPLVAVWLALFAFITYRMARLLALL